MKNFAWLLIVVSVFLTYQSPAQTYVSAEGAIAWQTRNDQRVPGDSGTDFSITDFKKGPFGAYRLYVGHIWNETHEIRALYAPFKLKLNGQFDQSVRFVDSTFAQGVDTEAIYKFNSYRLMYAYHFAPMGDWKLALGFTAKVRDAEVTLTQGALRDSKANVGFVPLLNFQAINQLSEKWLFRFDVDGLAAPQGRAFDAALFLERDFGSFSVFGGYRTVEGGADNAEVYNFAWLHFVTLGVSVVF